MGDISEIRGLIVIGTFLSVTLLLIGWMPYQFWVAGEEGRTIEVPEYFDSSDLIHWNSTYMMNITSNDFVDFWGKEQFGHHMKYHAWKPVIGDYRMANIHYFYFWFLEHGHHKMEWINAEGINRNCDLYEDEIQEDWDNNKNLASYTVKCSHFYCRADITYNTSIYESVHDAWASHDLHVIWGIEWDQMGTSYDAWALISSVLFFRPIAEIPFYISALIAIPVWIASAYIAYIPVLRAIGAVFGGGGA